MTQKLYQLMMVALFLLSIYGWGRITRRFLDRRIFIFHLLTAVLGLAFFGFIGGLLNLLHLARTPVLLVLLVIGLAVTTRHVLRQKPWQRRTFAQESIPLFVAWVMTLCVVLLWMPGNLF